MAATGGTLTFLAPILAPANAYNGGPYIDNNATLALKSATPSSSPFTFEEAGFYAHSATLSIRATAAGLNEQGVISGFLPAAVLYTDATTYIVPNDDTIAVTADPGLAVTSVVYTPSSVLFYDYYGNPTNRGPGSLTLYDGAAVLGTLGLAGTYAGDTLAGVYTGDNFTVSPDSAAANTYDIHVYSAANPTPAPSAGPNAPPTYAIAAIDAVKYEGDSGTTPFTFTVTRSGSIASSQILSYAVNTVFYIRQPGYSLTVDGADFVGGVLPSGTIAFAPGDVTKTIIVPVQGDTTVESDESFTVDISGAATITSSSASGAILNDDALYTVAALTPALVEGNTGITAFTFQVTRNTGGAAYTNSPLPARTFHYTVSGTGAHPADASDFGGTLPSGTVSFASGDASENVTVPVTGDTIVEPDKTFTIVLTDLPAANVTSTTSATILNDDASPPPAGTTTPDSYAWRNPVPGAWSNPANWTDLTTGGTPAAIAPGANDAVTIDGTPANSGIFYTVTGPGASNSLTILQNLTIGSNLSTGALTIGSSVTPGAVIIAAGSTDTATTANIVRGNLVVSGAAAQLFVSGALNVAASSSAIYTLAATGTGFIEAGSLNLFPGANPVRLAVDPSGRIEVGTLGTAAPGTVTIDPGATLSGIGSVESDVVDNGTIAISGGTMSFIHPIAGQGRILIGTGATAVIRQGSALKGTGPVVIAAGATLTLSNTYSGYDTAPIAFTGPGGTLNITQYDGSVWINEQGTIAGFAPGDTISFLGGTTSNSYTGTTTAALTDVGYTANGTGGGGTLSLFNNTTLLGNLYLLGDYTGAVFATTPSTTPFTYNITVARPDPLFDPTYYLAHNPDVAAAGADPYQHYVNYGWKEGRDPSALFDTNFYLTQNPDVRAAGVDPLRHFEAYGWKESRDPSLLFSESKYLAAYPDVASAGADPLLHYVLFGQQDGRMTFLSGPTASADPLVAPAFYDPQLGATIIPTGPAAGQQAAASYAATGWQKGLNPDAFFDTNYYLSHNPDVAAAHANPLLHFETYGWQEGRDPSAQFSTSKYLAAYADVRQAGIDPLLHYLAYGQAEGRQAFHT